MKSTPTSTPPTPPSNRRGDSHDIGSDLGAAVRDSGNTRFDVLFWEGSACRNDIVAFLDRFLGQWRTVSTPAEATMLVISPTTGVFRPGSWCQGDPLSRPEVAEGPSRPSAEIHRDGREARPAAGRPKPLISRRFAASGRAESHTVEK